MTTILKNIYAVHIVGPSGAERYLGVHGEVHDIEDAIAYTSRDKAEAAISDHKFVLATFNRFVPFMRVQKVSDPEWE